MPSFPSFNLRPLLARILFVPDAAASSTTDLPAHAAPQPRPALVPPLTGDDKIQIRDGKRSASIEWTAMRGSALWVETAGLFVKLRRGAEGLAVDIYENPDSRPVASTWAAYPDCASRVNAKATSSNKIFQIEFNAAPWLAEATIGEVLALSQSGWGGGDAANAVVHQLIGITDHDDTISLTGLVEYIEKHENLSFTCQIDGAQAMEWLQIHRCDIAGQLKPALQTEAC